MSVYKEAKTNTWRVVYRYVDWTGEKKQTQKRGFKTKREALAWEREQMNLRGANLEMTFESFIQLYEQDVRPRVKESTWANKENVIQTKLLPYFGKLKMCNITPQQIIAWQNEMINYRDEKGNPYSQVYLRNLHSHLSAIFNHAVKFYDLRNNPCTKAGTMGKKKAREMLYWTKEEYLLFAEEMMLNPDLYYAFEMLYWCGIRKGEMLALTPADFDLSAGTVSITKTYYRKNKQDIITAPKTEKSIRVLKMPQFLVEEVKDYMKMQYALEPNQRLFSISDGKLQRAMAYGAKSVGIKKIRIHDLRHSHVSLLANMGFSLFEVGIRMGHENEQVTAQYAHMFPGRQVEMANRLDVERWDKERTL